MTHTHKYHTSLNWCYRHPNVVPCISLFHPVQIILTASQINVPGVNSYLLLLTSSVCEFFQISAIYPDTLSQFVYMYICIYMGIYMHNKYACVTQICMHVYMHNNSVVLYPGVKKTCFSVAVYTPRYYNGWLIVSTWEV